MNTFHKLLLITASTMTIACTKTKEADHGINPANMDTTVTAAVDFYQYAGGGWIKSHPLRPEYSRYGAFEELREKNEERIRLLIEEMATIKNEQGSIPQKIGDLYSLGMDSVLLNKQGAAPIINDLSSIRAITQKSQLIEKIAEMNKQGIYPFFSLYVYADDMNSSMNILHLVQGGTNMGDRDYYLLQDEKTENIRAQYRKMIEKGMVLSGISKEMASIEATNVMTIETALAKVALSRVELRDPYLNYHKQTADQLQELSPAIQWSSLFSLEGMGEVDSLNIGQPKSISEVSNIINNTSLDILKSYLCWCLICNASPFLSDDFVNNNFEFYNKVLSGSKELLPRWKRVVGSVNNVLGEAVGKMYVERYFPASSKEKMLDLVGKLQESLGERILGLDWMGDSTKQKAIEKLHTFYVKIGYPDKWRDYSDLNIQLDSYWDNMKRSSAFEHAYNISKLNHPIDKDEWLMTPQTVNAYYNPATNEICFPAAILQPPFFDPKADDAVNYGAIGVVIGHEMTHGFDDQGRKYDKNGNLKEWWTAEDSKKFQERARVIEENFNTIIIVDSVHANGALTLGENIADYGGLTIAYNALQKLLKDLGKDQAIAGFTPQQRFFLSYASIWAENIRDEELLRRTKSDPHSMGRWRVNGTLPEIDAFYQAFDIKEGDPMYYPKEKRAHIW
ncbi:MAG: M13 family metallopeptidase [Bacteroidales bacterium]|nr:M13 family metallopeptidase [Bacteroidales bacterium]